MKLFDPNNPNEKKKMIAAATLGLIAVIVLGYVFFGGSSTKTSSNSTVGVRPSPTPAKLAGTTQIGDAPPDDPSVYREIVYTGTVPAVTEGNRNIFAYYEPPPPTPKLVIVPTPSPTPTPPLTAYSVNPSSVYARTPSDFSLQLTGDKFTPAVHIIIDGRDMPTRFISAQQLFTTVPAAMISNPGPRQIMARSPDGQLYSNMVSFNVTPPPMPNYSYVGIIGKPRFNDVDVLQDKGTKDLINVQRGEPVGGRFKVVSISEKEVVLIDTMLKIRHTLTFTADTNPNSPYRPPVRGSDDEP